MIFVMLSGRHRGLPSAIDQSVSLEKLLNTKKHRIGGSEELGLEEKIDNDDQIADISEDYSIDCRSEDYQTTF